MIVADMVITMMLSLFVVYGNDLIDTYILDQELMVWNTLKSAPFLLDGLLVLRLGRGEERREGREGGACLC